MRDNYAGDRGDFFKHGLLLALCQTGLRLGIIWYLFPDKESGGKGHGQDIKYLDKKAYQRCHPELITALKPIAMAISAERKVELIHTSGIFPSDTIYFEEPLSFSQHKNFLIRRPYRHAWFQRALLATQACDVVYLDPDTGLEPKSKCADQADDGPKYLAYDEVKALVERGQTVVIYQNRHRETPLEIAEQIRENFRLYLNITGPIPAYYFGAGQAGRMFLIIPARRHQAQIEAALANYNASPWQQFFRRL